MDTSEQYIKMCEKAGEIQALWKPQGGDWYLHDYRGSTGFERKEEKQIWGDTKSAWEKVEILAYKPSEELDTLVSTDGKESHLTSIKDLFKHRSIWLPRQDQLQKMVSRNMNQLIKQVGIVNCLHFTDLVQMLSMSWDQLWLMLVMRVNYNKVWDGKDWIKEVSDGRN